MHTGVLSRFSFELNFFSLRIPQNFVGELSCVAEEFWFGNKYEKKGVSRFFVDNFLSHIPKNFVGEHFCVLENVSKEKEYE